MKLTILRGLSGSGKSTWAESQAGHPVVVSRDRIRVCLFGTEAFIDEDLVTKIEHGIIERSLRSGRDVISDNTNIMTRYVNAIAAIGHKVGAEVEVKVFDVPLNTAIERNRNRAAMGGRDVPEHVIRKQHDRFSQSKNDKVAEPVTVKPYSGTPGKPEAFMVDIDGTLAHMIDRGPFDWHRVGEDAVDEIIADIVDCLHACHFKVIVMSGRDGVSREATEEWLIENDIEFDEIFMRAAGDMRKDSIVKAELFDEHVRDNFDVKFVLDDRNQVVDMWREMGLTCLQVAPGDF